MMDMFIMLTLVILPQCICIPNYATTPLVYFWMVFLVLKCCHLPLTCMMGQTPSAAIFPGLL